MPFIYPQNHSLITQNTINFPTNVSLMKLWNALLMLMNLLINSTFDAVVDLLSDISFSILCSLSPIQ